MPGNLKIDKDFETRKCTTSIGGGGEGELLPYMGYTNMSAPKEYFSHFDRFCRHLGLKQGMVFAIFS